MNIHAPSGSTVPLAGAEIDAALSAHSLDVLLVYLPVDFGCGRSFGLPPLGVFSLGSSLVAAGLSVQVIDANIYGLPFEEVLDRILKLQPRILGFSILTPHVRALTRLVGALRQTEFGGTIVCGGAHFNDTKAEYLGYPFAAIDYAMYGECEHPFTLLVQRLLAGQAVDDVPNLIFRRPDGEIAVNPQSLFIDDLDSLPFPDFSLGGTEIPYEMIYGRRRRAVSIMCSRGCPYLCTFCDVYSVWGRKVRNRSAANVCDEIEMLRDRFGIQEIFFRDSTFTLNYKWVNSLLDEMERRKIEIIWHCNARVDRITPELLARMKKNGLTCMSFGVESGDEEILDRVLKNISIEQVEKAFALCETLGIQTTAYFMAGNPGETAEAARKTMDLALRLPVTFVDVGPTVAYPGTETYRQGLADGTLADPQWYMRDIDMGQAIKGTARLASPGQLNLPGFPPEAQFAFCREFLRRFYLRPSAAWRILVRHFSWPVLVRSLGFVPAFLRLVLKG